MLEENASRRDLFRTPNDVSNSSSSLDLHSSTSDLTHTGYALSPLSTSLTTTNSLMANNIYTTGSTTNDTVSLSSNNISLTTNGTFVNGHQIDSIDLQAFESFHQGRSSNDNQFFVVIYLIDTFRYELTTSMNNDNETKNININDEMDSYVKKAIFRAYMDLIKDLPEKVSSRLNIQVNKRTRNYEMRTNKTFFLFRLFHLSPLLINKLNPILNYV